MRLKNISTTIEANKFLEEEFLPKFNAKFMVEPRSKANLHKKLNKEELANLDSIFSRQKEQVVMNDFTVSHQKKCYQLTKIQPVTICKRDRVIVEERMDKTIHIRLRGKYINYELLPEKPKKINNSKNNQQWIIPKTTAHIPPKNHPWRHKLLVSNTLKLTKMSQ